jgi:NAD(P)-dependent dehydrogenase (short-subunit alcohol dehydrogenase family)
MGLLDGKAAIVTGSSRGLGRAFAMALAAEGADVVVNGTDADAVRRVTDEITAAGGRAVAIASDVGDWATAKRLVDRCLEAFGRLDVLVSNAGILRATGNPVWEDNQEFIDESIRVNVNGVVYMTRHALGPMMAQGGGSIVNVTSGGQAGAYPGNSVYAATKAAETGFTFACADELAEHNVRVNAIWPFAATKGGPLGEAAETRPELRPENVAPLVVYLASDASWWVTGQKFRLQGHTLSLWSHSKPVHLAENAEGWTFERIRDRVDTAFRPRFEPVAAAAEGYTYDRVLRRPK